MAAVASFRRMLHTGGGLGEPRFGCTTINNKALYKCILHSLIGNQSKHTVGPKHTWFTFSLCFTPCLIKHTCTCNRSVCQKGRCVNLTLLTSKRGALATDARGCSLWRSLFPPARCDGADPGGLHTDTQFFEDMNLP